MGPATPLSPGGSVPEADKHPSREAVIALAEHFNQDRFAETESLARKMTQDFPEYPFGWKVLGAVLGATGQHRAALEPLRKAVELLPDDAEAKSNLGVALSDCGILDESLLYHFTSLQLRPNRVETYLNQAITLTKMNRRHEAEGSYRQALALKPDYPAAAINLGNLLMDTRRFEEAEYWYRRALSIQTDYTGAYSSLFFSRNYHVALSPAHRLAEAREYGALVTRLAQSNPLPPPIPRSTPHALRVGCVSGDFRTHAVAYFLESFLPFLDPQQVEILAYPNQKEFDAVSRRLLPLFRGWTPINGLSDEAACRHIREDQVDILIDLSGHTAHNRLPLFARRPAPLQISWLGYFATTGVAEMDYFLGDPWVIPEGEENQFSEAVWRLPETWFCMTPPEDPIETAPLPALTNGAVTFGCFNNLTKVSDETLALWTRILHEVPGSRLFLKTFLLNDVGQTRATLDRFAALGIPANRLQLEGSSPRAEYLGSHARVDIALDPFPYSGGTTTLDALWMGVPVLTRRGDRFVSRLGESIAHNAGLTHWIAKDDNDYVALARAFATDLAKLAEVRAALREQVNRSALFDARRFARHFQAALQGMWQAKNGAPR